MATDLTTTGTRELSSALATTARQARDYAKASKAANTTRAYRSDLDHFAAWCRRHQFDTMPAAAETVGLYLTAHADTLKPSTLRRRLSAISTAHRMAGYSLDTRHPAIRDVFAGIRRAKGVAPSIKAPAATPDLKRMLANLPPRLIGTRDRALLLLGFAGGFRRSEIAALDAGDVAFVRDGATVTLRRSKTDQEGEGAKVGIPYGSTPATCPVRALQDWIADAAITEGRLFRSINRHGRANGSLSAQSVALIVKRAAQGAGLDPAIYAGHSLRSGMATSAAANGASERAIMNQGRWRSVTVARGYIREGNLFAENAAASLGL